MNNHAKLLNNFCKNNFGQETKFTDELIEGVKNGESSLLTFVTHCLVFRLKKYRDYSSNSVTFLTLLNEKVSLSKKVSKYRHEFVLCNTKTEFVQHLTDVIIMRLMDSGLV